MLKKLFYQSLITISFLFLGKSLYGQSMVGQLLPQNNVNTSIATGDPNVGLAYGTFNHNLELKVPPAFLGLQPDISITYSKDKPDGSLGHGWSFMFLSEIERRSNSGGNAEFNSQDKFYLNGEELVKLEDGTYRTLRDDFTKYIQIRSDDHAEAVIDKQIYGWKAVKDGITYFFGSTTKTIKSNYVRSRNHHIIKPKVTAWLLRKVEDAFGNAYRISYRGQSVQLDQCSDPYLPTEIVYGENNSNRNAFKVEIVYMDREDKSFSFNNGINTCSDVLVKAVKSYVLNETVPSLYSHYQFNYELSRFDNQSLLKEVVRKSNSDQKQITIRKFNYGGDSILNNSASWENEKEIEIKSDSIGRAETDYLAGAEYLNRRLNLGETGDGTTFGSEIIDLNGDSRADLIIYVNNYNSNCESNHKVYLNTLDNPLIAINPKTSHTGFIDQRSLETPSFVYDPKRTAQINFHLDCTANPLLGAKEPTPIHRIVDINGDGFPELIVGNDTYTSEESKTLEIYIGSKNGWLETAYQPDWLYDNDGKPTLLDYQFLDLNGDGLVDLLGQTKAFLNKQILGLDRFNLNDPVIIDDPIFDQDGDDLFDEGFYDDSNPNFIHANSDEFFLYNQLGICDPVRTDLNTETLYYPRYWERFDEYDPEKLLISPEEFVWMNTLHADVNGDGLLDRIIYTPNLFRMPDMCEDGKVYKITSPGGHSNIYYGDGTGKFKKSDHTIGWHPAKTKPDVVDDFDPKLKTKKCTSSHSNVECKSIAFDYALNNVAFTDSDGNGHLELVLGTKIYPYLGQQGFGPQLSVLTDHEFPTLDNPLSFSHGLRTDHSDAFLTDFGMDPLSNYYQTFMDLNGDGLDDFVRIEFPEIGDKKGSPKIKWWRNKREVIQNRLYEIESTYGGKTELTWGNTARNNWVTLPFNHSYINSIKAGNGTTSYAYKGGRFDPISRRFSGFETVSFRNANKKTVTSHFYQHLEPLEGLIRSKEVYDGNGKIHSAEFYKYKDINMTSDGLFFSMPFTTHFFTPLEKVCRYEFKRENQVQAIVDALHSGAYEVQCHEFTDEKDVDVVFKPFNPPSQLFEMFNNGIPFKKNDTKETRKNALKGFAKSRYGLSISDHTGNIGVSKDKIKTLGNAFSIEQTTDFLLQLTNPTKQGFFKEWPFNGPVKITSGIGNSAETKIFAPTLWNIVEKGDMAFIPDNPLFEHFRMYVDLYEYDSEFGLLTKEYNLKDVSTVRDSEINSYSYHPFDTDFFWCLVKRDD